MAPLTPQKILAGKGAPLSYNYPRERVLLAPVRESILEPVRRALVPRRARTPDPLVTPGIRLGARCSWRAALHAIL